MFETALNQHALRNANAIANLRFEGLQHLRPGHRIRFELLANKSAVALGTTVGLSDIRLPAVPVNERGVISSGKKKRLGCAAAVFKSKEERATSMGTHAHLCLVGDDFDPVDDVLWSELDQQSNPVSAPAYD